MLHLETSSKLASAETTALRGIVRRMFRLDEDLSAFYAAVAKDPALSWVRRGAGRMMCSPTVFEDVVKTICTTNCAWSGTVRMVDALVKKVGGGAFPLPEEMARAPLSFYKDIARAGYRGPYLRDLAKAVSAGTVDLEALRPQFGLSDEEVEQQLRAINGVGPYACAHIMMLLGRYRQLVLDSWTRPTFLRLAGKRRFKDSSIERRFRPYGPYAGLAFWLFVTSDWVELP
ncbi:MAG: hypothetical protein NVS9B12_00670 [Vulcanimicrobiaceae bacterium]